MAGCDTRAGALAHVLHERAVTRAAQERSALLSATFFQAPTLPARSTART